MARNYPLNPKRNRGGIPGGTLVGNLGKGVGHEQVLDLNTVANAMAKGNNALSTGVAAQSKMFMTITLEGLFAADEWHYVPGPPVPTKLPAGGPSQDVAKAVFAGTNTTHFYLVTDVAAWLVSGLTRVCTVTFAAGVKTGTFSYAAPTTLPAGVELYIVCDHIPDPSLSQVELVFCGDGL